MMRQHFTQAKIQFVQTSELKSVSTPRRAVLPPIKCQNTTHSPVLEQRLRLTTNSRPWPTNHKTRKNETSHPRVNDDTRVGRKGTRRFDERNPPPRRQQPKQGSARPVKVSGFRFQTARDPRLKTGPQGFRRALYVALHAAHKRRVVTSRRSNAGSRPPRLGSTGPLDLDLRWRRGERAASERKACVCVETDATSEVRGP